MNDKTLKRAGLALLAAGGLAGTPAMAAVAVWDVDVNPTNGFGGLTAPWSLTDPGTIYAEWNAFDAYPVASSPDVGLFGTTVQLTETTGAAFLTSGGNIYSFAAATDFDLVFSGATASSGIRDVALRLGLLGTDVDPASVLLDGVAPSFTQNVYTEAVVGGFGGDENEWLFVWTGVGDRLSYQIDFTAASSSLSLDQLAVYGSTVVPVPAAAWLFGSALGLLGWVRRRTSAVA